MSNIRTAQSVLLARILDGPGKATSEQRRAAFDDRELAQPLAALLGKVALHAYSVTDADIAAARTAGVSEDQLFELTVCAAVGQAKRQHDAALAALAAAVAEH